MTTMPVVLHCKTDNVRVIADVLGTIALKKHQTAICTVTEAGLKVTVQSGKALQASALLREALFHSYSFNTNEGSLQVFHLDLTLFLNCIGLASMCDTNAGSGSFTMMQMQYVGAGHPLQLLLEDNGVLTECTIATLEPEAHSLLDFGFKAVPTRNNVIMMSDPLREAFTEMQALDKFVQVHITIAPSDVSQTGIGEPCLRLFANGSASQMEVQLTVDSEAFFKFECTAQVSQTYNLKFVKATLPALTASKEVRLRINDYGLLSLVAVITTEDEQIRTYVEYIISPEDDGATEFDQEELEQEGDNNIEGP